MSTAAATSLFPLPTAWWSPTKYGSTLLWLAKPERRGDDGSLPAPFDPRDVVLQATLTPHVHRVLAAPMFLDSVSPQDQPVKLVVDPVLEQQRYQPAIDALLDAELAVDWLYNPSFELVIPATQRQMLYGTALSVFSPFMPTLRMAGDSRRDVLAQWPHHLQIVSTVGTKDPSSLNTWTAEDVAGGVRSAIARRAPLIVFNTDNPAGDAATRAVIDAVRKGAA